MTYSPTEKTRGGTREGADLVHVTMPQMGVSVVEGTILSWNKRPGDWVEADETICEITTDKVDTEIPSPASGRVVRILVEVNETVAVGTPLAELDPSARPGEAHAVEQAEPAGQPHEPPPGDDAVPDRSHVISPVVQRMAAEHGVDLDSVTGTGVGGRIRKKDVLAHLEAGNAGKPKLHTESPYVEQDEREQPHARREPMSPMRRRIAAHMLESRRTAAHCTTVAEVDMTRVVERRRELKPAFASRGVPLTYLSWGGPGAGGGV
jgi:pyruvate/2-oxoglutarate dehydrogenase complex dihydrolipoamide acyltransferase (E2) component